MSDKAKIHASYCKKKNSTHVRGRWCWTPEEVESLLVQRAAGYTWQDIADSFKYHDRTTGQLIVYRHHSLDCHKKHVKEQGRPESDARAVVEFMAGDPAFLASSAEWRRARMYKERKDVENQGMDEKIGGSNDGSNAGVVPEQQKEE